MPYSHFLGYDKGKAKGDMFINEGQAATVRYIYRLFLEGDTPGGIAAKLNDKKIAAPASNNWQFSVVKSILTDEKYKGDALLQKSFTVDFLTKKRKNNEGEFPQYYVRENHPAIIEPVVFDFVQKEFAWRHTSERVFCGARCFSSKLICGNCGRYYGSKIWHSTSTADLVWQCNHRYEQAQKCKTPHLYDQQLRYAFNAAMLHLLSSRTDVIEDCKAMLTAVHGKSCKERRAKAALWFDDVINCQPQALVNDEKAWAILVQRVVVNEDRTLKFEFIDGSEFALALPDYSPRYRPASLLCTQNAPKP